LSLTDEYCDLKKDLKNNKNTFLLKYDYHKLSKPYIITKEMASMFPIIKELRDMYIDCFYELASSFKNNILTKDEIKKIFFSDSGNFTELKKNMVVGLHNHPSRAFATPRGGCPFRLGSGLARCGASNGASNDIY
jgi:hypothetical protein